MMDGDIEYDFNNMFLYNTYKYLTSVVKNDADYLKHDDVVPSAVP